MCKHDMCGGAKCAGVSMCMCGNKSLALLILRLVAGYIFLSAGIMKLQGMEMTVGFFAMMGIPAFLAWAVAILETLGGAMLILGVFARKAATVLAVIIAVAIVLVHAKGGMQEVMYPLSIFGMTVALAMMGSGRYSLMRLCKCGGTCMGCKDEKCAGGTCSAGAMKCDGCDACKGTCTMHEGK